MIWHILKKDLRLHRTFTLAIAVMQFALVAVHMKLGRIEENEAFSSLLLLLEIMMYFGAASLIASVVHQDALVGTRQDWLVRPIYRADLLRAKFVFTLIAVQLPMLLADFAGGLLSGSAFSHSLGMALSENLYFLVGFTIPILAFASLSRTMTEALGSTFALFMAILGLQVLVSIWNKGAALGPTTNTGIEWIPQSWRLLILALAGLAILGLQFFRRATRASRIVFAGAIVLCMMTEIVPWQYAFAMQKALSPAQAAANSIKIQFDPGMGKYTSPITDRPANQSGASVGKYLHDGEGTELYLPIQVSGIPADAILRIDHIQAEIFPANNAGAGIIRQSSSPEDFEIASTPGDDSSPATAFEPIKLDGSAYNKLKGAPVTIRLNYSVTILRLVSVDSIAAFNDSKSLLGIGQCETGLNDEQTAVALRCRGIGNPAQCISAVLIDPSDNAQNPTVHGCLSDYSPFYGRYRPPDTIEHTAFNLNFRDPSGLIHYPVDGSQVGRSNVILKSYRVDGHFTTHLVIPAILLNDWSAT